MSLSEAYKGGVIPVALVFDQPEDVDVKRPLRDTEGDGKKDEPNAFEKEQSDEDTLSKLEEQDVKNVNKNSKLLSLEARETDDDLNFGIQSRNKVPADESSEEYLKPFVYNIQPLSFYSAGSKDEESILNYINKIKEIRESQIKEDVGEKKDKKPVVQKHEDAVVTESEDSEEEEEGPIRRKIQHFETVIKPMMMSHQTSPYSGLPQGAYPMYPAATMGMQSIYPQPYQQTYPPFYSQNNLSPTVVYLPNPFQTQHNAHQNTKSGNTKIFDDYFPVVFNNPFNEIWAGITNIIEYGPAADVCRKNKKGRLSDEDSTSETIIDLPTSRRISLRPGSQTVTKDDDSWPKIARLKVRRGGVAIAGPGGIATAGSGGTAIVGPGGTAYTTREGTAVVGPGGKVVHVPQFPVYAKNVDGKEVGDFIPPPGSRTVAEGPIVYYDNPLDQADEFPDPSVPF